MHNHLYVQLGASLYVPGTQQNIYRIASGERYPSLTSVIFDLEDSVNINQVGMAYDNIKKMLRLLQQNQPATQPLIFIRVRHTESLAQCLETKYIELIQGFVLPKFTVKNMESYLAMIDKPFLAMPILEKDIFEQTKINEIRQFCITEQSKILSLRLGITDILSAFNMRRDCFTSLYDSPLINYLLNQIVTNFKPFGFNITAPVYECIGEEHHLILSKEIEKDLQNGFFGKTIIHPWQIDVVNARYKVDYKQLEIANLLLDEETPAVFKRYGQMHEKATHTNWAKVIKLRSKTYGITESSHLKLSVIP